ncbi:MAG: hypothetical protein JW900_15410, partial [Anaerolineae bacterium]|nr:hypothetical protein [Anaerolineae bacterium]
MLTRLRAFLAPPKIKDEEKSRVASLQHSILITLIVVTVLTLVVVTIYYGLPQDFEGAFTLLSGTMFIVFSLGGLFLNHRGYVRWAGAAVTAALWLVITSWVYTSGGIESDNTIIAYPLIIALAGVLMGKWGALATTIACLLSTTGVYYIETNEIITFAPPELGFFDLVILSTVLLLSGLLMIFSVNITARGFEHSRQNEQKLTASNKQLYAMRADLENRNAQLQSAVQEYVAYMTRVTQGDLSARLVIDQEQLDSDNPLTILGQHLDKTIAKLQQMTVQIRNTASNLAATAAQIFAATTEQAAGASQQAAAISETSSTIDEVRVIA